MPTPIDPNDLALTWFTFGARECPTEDADAISAEAMTARLTLLHGKALSRLSEVNQALATKCYQSGAYSAVMGAIQARCRVLPKSNVADLPKAS